MPIEFSCECGKRLRTKAEQAGKTGKCPACGRPIQVPPATPASAGASVPMMPDMEQEGNPERRPVGAVTSAQPAEQDDAGQEPNEDPHLCQLNAARERLGDDNEAARHILDNLLADSAATRPVRADANGLLGMVLKFSDHGPEAMACLEKALALGGAAGWSLCGNGSENLAAVYADGLADLYSVAAQSQFILLSSGDAAQTDPDLRDVEASLAKLHQLVEIYGDCKGFQGIKHRGMVLLGQGQLAGHREQWQEALECFAQVRSSPFKECFERDLRFVLGLALQNLGQITLLIGGDAGEAAAHLEESIGYYGEPREREGPARALQRARALLGAPAELVDLLNVVRHGDDKARIDALVELPIAAEGNLDAVFYAVSYAMRTGDDRHHWLGACALAQLGENSDFVAQALLTHMHPGPGWEENASFVKSESLKALSHMRLRRDLVAPIQQVAEEDEDERIRNGAICTLGAIGDPAAQPFLEFQAQQGNDFARAALALFGKAEWETICSIGLHGVNARVCGACGYEGNMSKTLLGKTKCPQCGKTGQDRAIWPGDVTR